MNAIEAFKAMKTGKKITRKCAANPHEYFRIVGNTIISWNGESDNEQLIDGVFSEAIFATDYIIQESKMQPKYMIDELTTRRTGV